MTNNGHTKDKIEENLFILREKNEEATVLAVSFILGRLASKSESTSAQVLQVSEELLLQFYNKCDDDCKYYCIGMWDATLCHMSNLPIKDCYEICKEFTKKHSPSLSRLLGL